MDEIELAAVANAIAERIGTPRGRLIGVDDPDGVDLGALARPYRDGDYYEAGAVIAFAGGLWQARNKTGTRPPGRIGEWLLLANGIRAVHAYQQEPRGFGFVVTLSSGQQIDLPFELPLPLHRGPYREHEYYSIADEVEHEGATWRARRAGAGVPSADNPDWRLISARGIKGDRGEEGPRGWRGERGPPGVGEPGPRGEKGERGERGFNGPGIKEVRAVDGFPGEIVFLLEDGTLTEPIDISQIRFAGGYEPGRRYDRGDVVRFSFHLWVALQPTDEMPQISSSSWEIFLTGVDPSGIGGGGGRPGAGPGGGIGEAPEDGTPYARQDAGWVPALEEAPQDATPYARQDAGWQPTVSFPEAPNNTTLHARRGSDQSWQPAMPAAGGAMTGPLFLSGPPTEDLHAATKAYVDTAIGGPLAQRIAALERRLATLEGRTR